MNGRAWTEGEIAYLESVWGNVAHSRIAKKLNRTRLAVRNKAFSMGLRADNDFMSVNEIAEAMNVHPHTIVHRWIGKNGLPCKKSHYTYRIQYDDLMSWLHDNPGLWSAKTLEPYALGSEPDWLIDKRKHEQLPKGGSPWLEHEKSAAVIMYRKGATNKEIGAAFGRTEEAARKLLYRLGVYGGTIHNK